MSAVDDIEYDEDGTCGIETEAVQEMFAAGFHDDALLDRACEIDARNNARLDFAIAAVAEGRAAAAVWESERRTCAFLLTRDGFQEGHGLRLTIYADGEALGHRPVNSRKDIYVGDGCTVALAADWALDAESSIEIKYGIGPGTLRKGRETNREREGLITRIRDRDMPEAI